MASNRLMIRLPKLLSGERWKFVRGRAREYLVSTHGRVASTKYGNPARLLSPGLEIRRGYLRVSLTSDNKLTTAKVHRLVAIAFLPNPNNLPEVNHKDGIKTNNHVDNLEWCDRPANMRHSYRMGMHSGLRIAGERHHYAKLTDQIIRDIRRRYGSGRYTHRYLSRKYRVSRGNIANIVNYRTWKHVV